MNIFNAMIKCLLAEASGKTRDEYETAALQHIASRGAEQDAIAAFMSTNKIQPNTSGKHAAKRSHASMPSNEKGKVGGDAEATRIRTLAYGLQHRMGVEIHPVDGRGFDAAVNEFSTFLTSGAPRRDQQTDEPKPLNPVSVVSAWKKYFGYIPKSSKWFGKV